MHIYVCVCVCVCVCIYIYMHACMYMYSTQHSLSLIFTPCSFHFFRLWEEGWKERYYETKFDVSHEDTEFVRQVVESYTEGLCWVMGYYYQVQCS